MSKIITSSSILNHVQRLLKQHGFKSVKRTPSDIVVNTIKTYESHHGTIQPKLTFTVVGKDLHVCVEHDHLNREPAVLRSHRLEAYLWSMGLAAGAPGFYSDLSALLFKNFDNLLGDAVVQAGEQINN